MQKCIVYRWEHSETGSGPYRCDDYSLKFKHSDESHPTIYEDGWFSSSQIEIITEDDYAFGFSSLEQMCNWFKDWEMVEMLEHGFVLVKYEANEYFHGRTQTCFKKWDYNGTTKLDTAGEDSTLQSWLHHGRTES